MTFRKPKILLHIKWVVNPERVPKGSYERIEQPEPNHVVCIVHDEADKRRFMQCIARAVETTNGA